MQKPSVLSLLGPSTQCRPRHCQRTGLPTKPPTHLSIRPSIHLHTQPYMYRPTCFSMKARAPLALCAYILCWFSIRLLSVSIRFKRCSMRPSSSVSLWWVAGPQGDQHQPRQDQRICNPKTRPSHTEVKANEMHAAPAPLLVSHTRPGVMGASNLLHRCHSSAGNRKRGASSSRGSLAQKTHFSREVTASSSTGFGSARKRARTDV